MTEFYCEAHMSKPKSDFRAAVRFVAVPGYYQCADQRVFTSIMAADKAIERLEKRWGHPIQVFRNSSRAPSPRDWRAMDAKKKKGTT